jgi:hypothetical protein
MSQKTQKSEPLDNLEWELFCQNFVKNPETFNNGMRTLAFVRNQNPDKNEDEDEKTHFNRINVLRNNASRLLTKANIEQRIRFLFLELFDEVEVDKQLSKVIQQDNSWSSKVDAIREFNKLKQRIVEKTDITSGGKPLSVEISGTLAKKYNVIKP